MPRLVVTACLTVAFAFTFTGHSSLGAQGTVTSVAKSFDVASVKPSDPAAAAGGFGFPVIPRPVRGRFRATNVPLRQLVELAFAKEQHQITGGSDALLAETFDIIAQAEASATMRDVALMLRSLLVERFRLRAHTETRQLPVYQLVVARSDGTLGPDLTPSTADCANVNPKAHEGAEASAGGTVASPRRPFSGETRACAATPIIGGGTFGSRANGQPIAMLVKRLAAAVNRTVVDKTGLVGLYDWRLEFDPESVVAGPLRPSSKPALTTALRDQLGLKFEARRSPVEVLVIDAVERPAPD